MGLRETLTEAALNAVTSPRGIALRHRLYDLKSRAAGRKRRVRFFLGFHDPYSYLLAPMVYEVPHRWAIEVDWLPLTPAVAAESDNRTMRLNYALTDAAREAERLRYPFKRRAYPEEANVFAALAGTEAARATGKEALFALTALGAIWGEGGDLRTPALLKQVCDQVRVDHAAVRGAVDRAETVPLVLDKNEALLRRLGHWAPGTLELDGEWFAGPSRFDFLMERLDAMGLRR